VNGKSVCVLSGLVVCLIAGGCTDQRIGSGPLKLSPQAQAHYDKYRSTVGPGAFVLSERGDAFFSYCPEMGCAPGSVFLAMRLCRQSNRGECYIYDIEGRVVWRFDEPPPATLRATSAPDVQLIHCMLRGSIVLTTESACLGDGGSVQESRPLGPADGPV